MKPLRSKSVAAWLALVFGALGLHRLYLHGPRDWLGWAHPLPTLLGLFGVQRLMQLGQDDHVAWALIPLLGLMISQGMLAAIVYGLTADDKWAARHNPGQAVVPTTWPPVLAAMLALLVGGAVLMGTIAYGGQMFFQWQLDETRDGSR
jgi:hypothetical protein